MISEKMLKFHEAFERETTDWPRELRIYAILALYQKLSGYDRQEVLDHLSKMEESEMAETLADFEGTRQ